MNFDAVKERLRTFPWGATSLVSLYLSLVSGVLVALQYDLAAPFHSTLALSTLAPYGEFFRSLHFYSSQGFFLLMLVHFLAVFAKTENYSRSSYSRLIIAIAISLLLLFTGYILRADSTGYSAGVIAEEIFTNLPIIGAALNAILFSVTDHGVQRIYVHHVITYDLLWLALVWEHLRRYRIQTQKYLWLILIFLGLSTVVAAPMDQDKLGIHFISGPWFFLGLQELLRYFNPILAGIVFPVALMAALLCLHKKNRYWKAAWYTVWGWALVYAACSGITLLR